MVDLGFRGLDGLEVGVVLFYVMTIDIMIFVRSGRDRPATMGAAYQIMATTRNTSSTLAPRPRLAGVLSFPDPVNEISARLVAGGVVLLSLAAIVLAAPWLILVIAYGFVARVLAGPTFSPLGQLVTRVITPRLGVAPRLVPGPPKRFAQAIGATFSISAAVLAVGFGATVAADALLGCLILAATLESVFSLCLGCKLFAVLMRLGVVPTAVCERCNNIAAATPG